MLASERGAARNTLLAYGRDLEQAEELIGTALEAASAAQLAKLGQAWSAMAPATLARKISALRQFFGFLVDEGLRDDDPTHALPRPATRRPLPKILTQAEIERLFATAEAEAESAARAESELGGVDLDAEAAQLMQQQQAYQANAQVLSVARSLFDTLLQAI